MEMQHCLPLKSHHVSRVITPSVDSSCAAHSTMFVPNDMDFPPWMAVPSGSPALGCTRRLSTVKDADSIAVMDKGRVAELGPHEELVKSSGGIYSNLVRRQLEGLSSSMSDM